MPFQDLYQLRRSSMLNLKEIKKQTLPHVIDIAVDRWGHQMSDETVLDAYEWVVEVIYDYHRVHDAYDSIKRSDVEYFIEAWCQQTFSDPAPAEPHDEWGAPLQEAN